MTSLRAAWPAHEHVRMSGRHTIKRRLAHDSKLAGQHMSPCRPATGEPVLAKLLGNFWPVHDPVPAKTLGTAGQNTKLAHDPGQHTRPYRHTNQCPQALEPCQAAGKRARAGRHTSLTVPAGT